MEIILKTNKKDKEKTKTTIEKSKKILWEYYKESMEEYEDKIMLDALYNILDIFRDYEIKEK